MLPKFVDMHGLAQEAMRELLPLHEKWAGAIIGIQIIIVYESHCLLNDIFIMA